MSLKALAKRVLDKQVNNVISVQFQEDKEDTVQDFIDAIEERAAIIEFDAADCYQTREQATAAAYENCKIIFLARYRLDLNKKGTST